MTDWNVDLTSTRPYDDDEDGESLCQKGVLYLHVSKRAWMSLQEEGRSFLLEFASKHSRNKELVSNS